MKTLPMLLCLTLHAPTWIMQMQSLSLTNTSMFLCLDLIFTFLERSLWTMQLTTVNLWQSMKLWGCLSLKLIFALLVMLQIWAELFFCFFPCNFYNFVVVVDFQLHIWLWLFSWFIHLFCNWSFIHLDDIWLTLQKSFETWFCLHACLETWFRTHVVIF